MITDRLRPAARILSPSSLAPKRLPSRSRAFNRSSPANAMVEQLPRLPDIERLSPLVVRVLGGNPSKYTLQGTNTYVVGRGKTRILIDTGEGKPAWAESLRKALADEEVTVDQVILTHWHADHVSGVSDVLAANPAARVFKNQPGRSQEGISDGQVFRTEGATLRAFHCPGHTVDHMALILEEEGAMFTGDNVLGHGTAVFEDLAAYMDSLERMRAQFSGRAYPGHGAVIEDGVAKIKEYVAHRHEREEQVVAVMRGDRGPRRGDDGEGWASMSMVKIIYSQYPEHLHGPAEGSVVQVLKKMEGDGRVRRHGDGTWSLTKKAAL